MRKIIKLVTSGFTRTIPMKQTTLDFPVAISIVHLSNAIKSEDHKLKFMYQCDRLQKHVPLLLQSNQVILKEHLCGNIKRIQY